MRSEAKVLGTEFIMFFRWTMLGRVLAQLLVVYSLAVNSELVLVGKQYVLTPLEDASGPEVAILLVPGYHIKNDQYAQFGEFSVTQI